MADNCESDWKVAPELHINPPGEVAPRYSINPPDACPPRYFINPPRILPSREVFDRFVKIPLSPEPEGFGEGEPIRHLTFEDFARTARATRAALEKGA